MNHMPAAFRRHRVPGAVLLWTVLFAIAAVAQEPPPAPAEPVELPAAQTPETPQAPPAPAADRHGSHDFILRFNKDSDLPAGESADAVVTISGSTTIEGIVRETVISVFGDTHIAGPVGDTTGALFGDVYVDSSVRGDVFSLFGNVNLGPHAEVAGDVTVVGGDSLKRDAAAVVHGDINQVTLPFEFGRFEWLRPWVSHCLLLGRPLAFVPGIAWAWTLALGFLAFYVVLTLMFSGAVERCAQTIETRPGRTLLASLLTLLLTPIVSMVLAITVVGGVLLPFLWLGLFIVGLFGKAVMLGTLGRRVTHFFGEGPMRDITVAVVIGGVVTLLLYTVPVLGFILYKLLGILGMGVVVYTLLIAAQQRREAATLASQAAAVSSPPPAAQPEAPAADVPGSDAGADNAAQTAAPAAVADATLPRAGFWIRMTALFIDAVLVGVALSLTNIDDVYLLMIALYGALMWKFRGTTVGGIVCNLKVVRVDGRELDWNTAVVRALSCFLSLALAGLGFIWIAVDEGRRAWHDKIAGTAVVRVPHGVSLV
jgi:uncharacterized RDD family membrane protein YckC